MQDYLQPPSYCPDAIATDVGWINPKNGELLISVRNLRQKIAEKEKTIIIHEDVVSITEKILDSLTEQQNSDTIQETVKRGRGRPKKVKEEENEQM